MGKKKSWKRRVFKISLIVFGLVILLLIGSYYLLIKSMQGPEKIELTEYYPFVSAEAKEQILAMNRELEKIYWPAESESRYIDTTYGKTFVRITGPKDARPLVLIQSLGSSLNDWSGIINKLSKEFRTYTVDTVGGMGLSICTTPITKSDDYVQWLDELVTKLGLENNINLMGCAYGAWITSQYVIYKQNRVSKVVFLGPYGTVAPINPQVIVRILPSILPFKYFKDSYNLWLDPTVKEFNLVKQLQDFFTACEKSYKVTFTLPPTVLSDDELKSIKCPALFLVGEHERLFSPEKAMDRLERIVPNFKKKIIPSTGHLSMPYSLLTTEAILAFLRE